MYKNLLSKFKYFLLIGRYDKPHGALLLMWPCFWGAAYANDLSLELIKFLFLFFLGSFVMRGAGCTINDIIDVKYDRKVERTKNRPLASKKINKTEAIFFLIFQLILGLLVVVNFSMKVIFLSFAIIPFVFLYPFVKRITFFPQLFLGFIFNWGILIGYFSLNNEFNIGIFYLYFAGVFLTLGYDTIYGFQDINDDRKIGVKSLSIRIKDNYKKSLGLIYTFSWIFFLFSHFSASTIKKESIIYLILIMLHMIYQIKKLNIKNQIDLKNTFNSNVILGFVIFLGIFFNNFFF